jgi:hypothetical protein
MHVTGSAAADTNGQLSGELRFGAGGKGRGLLVAVVVPAERPSFPDLVGDRIGGITYYSMDLGDPRGGQGLDKHFCNFHDHSFVVIQVTQSPYQKRVYFLWQIEYALLPSLLGFLRVVLPWSLAMLCGDQTVLPAWDVCKWSRPYSSWDRSFLSLPCELYGLVSPGELVGPGIHRDQLGVLI